MHGYFLQLKLYDAARMISNPFAYEEHREKLLKEKMAKLSDSRIRTKKGDAVKVNKALAEKIQRAEEKEEKKKARKAALQVGGEEDAHPANEKANLMTDSRFKAMFENPQFEIDEESREFSLLNPSTVVRVNISRFLYERSD
jgi:ribosome biogenesis protein ENP2